MKTTRNISIVLLFLGTFLAGSKSYAHCEIPCGIYGDSLRIEEIREHITTIEKSMNMINELSAQSSPDYHQLIRWVINKEEHAKKIQGIVSQYFLHQRIKPTDQADSEKYDKYIRELTLLHELLVQAMKSKQSADLDSVKKMRSTVDKFAESYFHAHDHHH